MGAVCGVWWDCVWYREAYSPVSDLHHLAGVGTMPTHDIISCSTPLRAERSGTINPLQALGSAQARSRIRHCLTYTHTHTQLWQLELKHSPTPSQSKSVFLPNTTVILQDCEFSLWYVGWCEQSLHGGGHRSRGVMKTDEQRYDICLHIVRFFFFWRK